jgi:hypothetical protein
MAKAKKSPPKLRTLIRQVYSGLKKGGAKQVTIHEIIIEIERDHPKLVKSEKDRLFHEAIGSWTRQILKSDSNSLRSTQLSLPLDLKDAVLPVCIPIFSTNRKIREAEWIELYDATFAQLTKEIDRRTAALQENPELRSLERARALLARSIRDGVRFS